MIAQRKTGGGTRQLPAEFKDRVKERPDFLDRLVGRSERKARYVKLAEAVKALASTQTIHYTVKEFSEQFGGVQKNHLANMKISLKTQGVHHPRVVEDDGIVYVWSNGKD